MKVTNRQLRSGYQALQKLTRSDVVPIREGLTLARNRKKLEDDVEALDDARERLVKRHAETDDDGEPKRNDSGGYLIEDRETFLEEFNALLDDDVEIPNLNGVPLKKIEDSDLRVSGEDLLALLELGIVVDGS